MNVLSLCDLTGNAVKPWANAGYKCFCIDIQHTRKRTEGNITFLPYDVLDLVTDDGMSLCDWLEWSFVFAWPPCTDLTNSSSGSWKRKGLSALVKAAALVDHCKQIAEQSNAPYLIENPVGQLSTYWRKPDYKFDPFEYGGYHGGFDDGYTKKTCLWTGNDFKFPPKRPIELCPETHDRIHKMSPSADRSNKRSISPVGFCQAVFEANHGGEFEPIDIPEPTTPQRELF